jgi:hypothetical protein
MFLLFFDETNQKFKSYVGKVPNSNQPPNHGDYDLNNNKHKRNSYNESKKSEDTVTVTCIVNMLRCLFELRFTSINRIFIYGS